MTQESLTQGEQGPVVGPVPLTPIQRWFLDRPPVQPHHFNQAVLLEALEPLSMAALDGALAALMEHHDALRMRFICGRHEWRSEIRPTEAMVDDAGLQVIRIDLSRLGDGLCGSVFETLTAWAQGSLHLGHGPIQRVVHFDFGSERPARLLWVIHHLMIDGVSWRILLADFLRAYRQAKSAESIALPPRSTSWKAWSEGLQVYASSSTVQEEEAFWRQQCQEPLPLPVDFPGGSNLVRDEETITAALSREETERLLTEAHTAYHTQINDLLLAAFLRACHQWTGHCQLRVDLESHGREQELFPGVDLSRTVGWFTSLYPLVLEALDPTRSSELIKAVKEQLRAVPRGGVGYGLRHHGGKATRGGEGHGAMRADIAFNYLGQLDGILPAGSPLRPLREGGTPGPPVAAAEPRSHRLEVVATVSEGRLRVRCTYSRTLHLRKTIERLVEGFLEALRDLVEHCLAPQVGSYTPSDFPEARMDQESLDKLLARLGSGDEGRRT